MTPTRLVASVAHSFGLSAAQVRSKRQDRWHVSARREAAKRLRAECPYLSLASIGELLGGRDHSTVHSLLRGPP